MKIVSIVCCCQNLRSTINNTNVFIASNDCHFHSFRTLKLIVSPNKLLKFDFYHSITFITLSVKTLFERIIVPTTSVRLKKLF